MTRLKKFIAQGVAAGFEERHFVPGRILAAKPRDARAGAAGKRFNFRESQQSFEFQLVGLRQVVRLKDAVGEVPVVGEEYEPGRMVLEPPNGKHALGNSMEQVAKRGAAF